MPTFKYVSKDWDSKSVVGKIVADDEGKVIEELRKRNLTIISIDLVKESAARKAAFGGAKVKEDDLVIFSRQLSTMIDSGIPILQALDALQEQITHPGFKGVVVAVRDDIQMGGSLSASFAKHPRAFDTLFVNMVKVGETGGVLSQILDRIAGYLEKSLRLKRKVQSAMIYPAVVVTMAALITILLLVKVVPTFAGIYTSFNKELPGMTQALINVSNLLQHNLLGLIAGVVIFGFLLNRAYRTDMGRLYIDSFVLKMPIFGDIIRKVAIARFSRTLSILLQTGVPILESFDIVGKSSGNRVIEGVIETVKANVAEGESIAAPLLKSGVFPPMVTRMISIGEKSGQLEKMLTKIADFYDDQVDTAVNGLTSIIEPLIIGVLGIVVGFIVIALFMPIISITTII
ncbi:MAG: type II secretion system F family protein [Candidatus Omnitrophica bacterium]|nr:type II secretion system F family protein [Candidatus Omnitrophota bacterium]